MENPFEQQPQVPPGQVSTGFQYDNCLDREYCDKKHIVNNITFFISRYREYSKTITFKTPVTEKHAILAAEQYLSKPLTKKYYERIKEDTFHGQSWEDVKEIFTSRGDCLTSAVFLEEVTISEAGHLTMFIGS